VGLVVMVFAVVAMVLAVMFTVFSVMFAMMLSMFFLTGMDMSGETSRVVLWLFFGL